MTIDEIQEAISARQTERDEAHNEQRAIHAEAGEQPLTRGQQERFDRRQRQVERLDAELLELRRQQVGHFAGQPGATESGDGATAFNYVRDHEPWSASRSGNVPNPMARPSESRTAAMRAIERSQLPDDGKELAEQSFAPGQPHDQVARGLIALSDPCYSSAFSKVLTDPERGHLEFDQAETAAFRAVRESQRAMSQGGSGTAGFAIPTHLDPAFLMSDSGAISPMRRIARIERGVTPTWNGVSSTTPVASWDAESTDAAVVAVSDDTPTLAQPSVTAHKLQAWVPASWETAQDVANLSAELAVLFMDSREVAESAAFFTGSGTGEPDGVVTDLTATSSQVNMATHSVFAVTDLLAAYEALPGRFRGKTSTAWAANLAYLNRVRQFGSGTEAHWSYTVDLTAGAVGNVLGAPAYEASNMTGALGSTATQHAFVYGDFQSYLIYDRFPGEISFVPHLFSNGADNRPTSQVGWLYRQRTGGGVLVRNALRLSTNPKTT